MKQEKSQDGPMVITVEAVIHAPIALVWDTWNQAEHMIHWSYAGDDWHCPKAEVNLQVGNKFSATMAAKDGSEGFDFEGFYDVIEPNKRIDYHLEDGRKVSILFTEIENGVHIRQSFDAETTNPIEMQQGGWQMILNNYKKYTESISQ